jgi:hypothetical protein
VQATTTTAAQQTADAATATAAQQTADAATATAAAQQTPTAAAQQSATAATATAVAQQTADAQASPTLAPGASFIASAYVSPNPVSYGAYPTLYTRTAVGAVCTASVVYSTGYAPRSFDGSAQTVDSSGVVGWTWHMESRGTGGTATVTCSFEGQTRSATAGFSIA